MFTFTKVYTWWDDAVDFANLEALRTGIRQKVCRWEMSDGENRWEVKEVIFPGKLEAPHTILEPLLDHRNPGR